mmetsp:Transcript_78281/g.175058  ORF Transcript_78281/g.175058 Transcript_78281/m.175058 type:complete len:217 (-) Transcript_78281:20-670(-)
MSAQEVLEMRAGAQATALAGATRPWQWVCAVSNSAIQTVRRRAPAAPATQRNSAEGKTLSPAPQVPLHMPHQQHLDLGLPLLRPPGDVVAVRRQGVELRALEARVEARPVARGELAQVVRHPLHAHLQGVEGFGEDPVIDDLLRVRPGDLYKAQDLAEVPREVVLDLALDVAPGLEALHAGDDATERAQGLPGRRLSGRLRHRGAAAARRLLPGTA